jgi:hypothetical protein
MIRLLLDENLPKKLKYRFGDDYHVTTVPEEGWSSLKNGELLQAMHDADIQYFITGDKNLSYQQNYQKLTIRLIVLNARNNQYETLLPFVAKIKALFEADAVENYNWLDL